MSRLRSFVERLVARLKHEPTYRIASDYSDSQLLRVLWYRGWQVFRGLPLRVQARAVRGVVFRGRRVVNEHAAQFTAGPSLILEDDVFVSALSVEGVVLGRNVTIARGTILTCTGVLAELGKGIRIGNRSAIGARSFLGGQGGIQIGDDVIIGPGVHVFSENHRYDAVDRPIRSQGQTRETVTIDDDCWIGARATILAGVTIGTGSVVAAGAVVTRSVPPFSVVAGVPARVIRSRRPDQPPSLDAVGSPEPPELLARADNVPQEVR